MHQIMDTNSFQETIAKGQEILIVVSKEPDFDRVAAALSLYLSLTDYGRKVSIFCPTQMLVDFNRLVGVDKITREVGDKNLTITLAGYPAQNIERVSYNIENGQMRLAIIPKPGALSPQLEQVTSTYSGMSADTIISLGSQNLEEMKKDYPEIGGIEQQILISKEQRPGEQTSCFSERVSLLLHENNMPISQDTAGNLMLGMTTATGNFSSPGVRPETFEVAARLLRIRGKVVRGQAQAPQDEEPEEKLPSDWVGPKVYKGTTLP